MKRTVASLHRNGLLEISGELDEVSRTTIGSSIDVQYASEFDEVTINPVTNGLVKRETRDGKLLVGGYFDEWTTALDAP